MEISKVLLDLLRKYKLFYVSNMFSSFLLHFHSNPFRSVAPARSFALRESDCIVLIGARLNWILHFGLPPRFNKDVKIIQVLL